MSDLQSSKTISFEVDVSDTSNMFCCMICQELIQSADNHRQCASQPGGDGCGNAICVPCIAKLEKRHCPICGSNFPGVFVSCPIMKKWVYPQVSKKCPIEKCGRNVLTLESHGSECEWRMIECAVCAAPVSIADIHEHLNTSCTLPWAKCEVGDARIWTDSSLIGTCANPIDPTQRTSTMLRICLNPSGESLTDWNKRMIYVWRTESQIKFWCIQLCAAAGELQALAIDDDSQIIACQINSLSHFPGPIGVSVDDFLSYNTSLGLGPWNLQINELYAIETGVDKDPMTPDFIANNFRDIGIFRGHLLEILWGPPRGVFVNQFGQTYMANLDFQTMKKIKVTDISTMNRPQMMQGLNEANLISMIRNSAIAGGRQNNVIHFIPMDEHKHAGRTQQMREEKNNGQHRLQEPSADQMINTDFMGHILGGEPILARELYQGRNRSYRHHGHPEDDEEFILDQIEAAELLAVMNASMATLHPRPQ